MAENQNSKLHFCLCPTGKAEPFTSTSRGGGNPNIPKRNRQQHGYALIGQLRRVKQRQSVLHEEAEALKLESLLELEELEVEMTVTLSYFIEPNPSSRIVSRKYSYQSHGLRFDVKRPLKSIDDFRKRINRQARDEEEGTTNAPSDPNWLLGSHFRNKSSIHKDVWKGKAVELAERGQIAVFR